MPYEVILASKSTIRKRILENSGIVFSQEKSNVNEKIIKKSMLHDNAKPDHIALKLAELKARNVARYHPHQFIIGCDQILEMDGNIFDKPKTKDALLKRIEYLSGASHKLFSAVCVVLADKLLWHHIEVCEIIFKKLVQQDIKNYVDTAPKEVLKTVGGYQLEGVGIQLIQQIKGDYLSALGLPLLPLLHFLCDHQIDSNQDDNIL